MIEQTHVLRIYISITEPRPSRGFNKLIKNITVFQYNCWFRMTNELFPDYAKRKHEIFITNVELIL